ncbi:hypothetical protein [Myxococcus qinghaiensis]|uniref:hypothetical protein n=1 Tax=Myxococcus qinghaiensis TaxID=2906758 RepID=UPI0020A7E481|nr:hypothetical protein [Myxococcus qinghaiensis]MCP3164277.1 hypothetical protein [Myxococcus qinghaiensis]
MEKTLTLKLSLDKETLREIKETELLDEVLGGITDCNCTCNSQTGITRANSKGEADQAP